MPGSDGGSPSMDPAPQPPPELDLAKKVVQVQRLRAGGIALVGIGFCGLVLVMALMLVEVRSARRDQEHAENDREEAEAVTQCYRDVSSEPQRLLGEINIVFAQAVLHAYLGATEEQLAERAAELTFLVNEWEQAQDVRDQANELCRSEEEDNESATPVPTSADGAPGRRAAVPPWVLQR